MTMGDYDRTKANAYWCDQHKCYETGGQNCGMFSHHDAGPIMDPLDSIRGMPGVPFPEVEDFKGDIDGGGYKTRMDDPAKLQPTLIPPSFIEGVSKILQFGARKYSRGNWMRGMPYSSILDATMTHLLAIQRGEDIDLDSGLPHKYHAACNLAFLSWYQDGPDAEKYAKFDDRLFSPEGPHGQG